MISGIVDYESFNYITKTKLPYENLHSFIGKKLVQIGASHSCDDGLTLIFDDDQELEIGYSSCEGRTMINGKEVDI